MAKKERLDVLLVQKGLFETREKAKRSIMAGIVFVDNQKIDKAGTQVPVFSDIYIKKDICPYVSRGGLKLERALEYFNLNLENKIAMDIGASTGGFTDCMLQKGALKVYALDVGYGQLDWKLRNDPRVVNMEKINVRYLDVKTIQEPIDFVTIDVSFISLTLILPVAYELLEKSGSLVCLIKPQFEAGRQQVGKNGIVKDKTIHVDVIEKIIAFSREIGFSVKDLTYSPVKGTKGNIEYLLYLANCAERNQAMDIVETVNKAHAEL